MYSGLYASYFPPGRNSAASALMAGTGSEVSAVFWARIGSLCPGAVAEALDEPAFAGKVPAAGPAPLPRTEVFPLDPAALLSPLTAFLALPAALPAAPPTPSPALPVPPPPLAPAPPFALPCPCAGGFLTCPPLPPPRPPPRFALPSSTAFRFSSSAHHLSNSRCLSSSLRSCIAFCSSA